MSTHHTHVMPSRRRRFATVGCMGRPAPFVNSCYNNNNSHNFPKRMGKSKQIDLMSTLYGLTNWNNSNCVSITRDVSVVSFRDWRTSVETWR